jgi:ketosteroid isomerase-like protein
MQQQPDAARAGFKVTRRNGKPMSDFQAIADRVEIEALRGEAADAAMMRDADRLASLFTSDGVLLMPNIPAEFHGQEEIRAGNERLQAFLDYFVQTTHPGTILLDGDTASDRAYIHELARARDGRQGLNYAIYHDRYRRTADGWKFTERVFEVRYLDASPLAGSAPGPAGAPADPPAGDHSCGGRRFGLTPEATGTAPRTARLLSTIRTDHLLCAESCSPAPVLCHRA